MEISLTQGNSIFAKDVAQCTLSDKYHQNIWPKKSIGKNDFLFNQWINYSQILTAAFLLFNEFTAEE